MIHIEPQGLQVLQRLSGGQVGLPPFIVGPVFLIREDLIGSAIQAVAHLSRPVAVVDDMRADWLLELDTHVLAGRPGQPDHPAAAGLIEILGVDDPVDLAFSELLAGTWGRRLAGRVERSHRPLRAQASAGCLSVADHNPVIRLLRQLIAELAGLWSLGNSASWRQDPVLRSGWLGLWGRLGLWGLLGLRGWLVGTRSGLGLGVGHGRSSMIGDKSSETEQVHVSSYFQVKVSCPLAPGLAVVPIAI
jgi:hypothetical protein